jgi:hypothetical protein
MPHGCKARPSEALPAAIKEDVKLHVVSSDLSCVHVGVSIVGSS